MSERNGYRWQSRDFVVTPELLGLRSATECQERAAKLGFTPLPLPRYRQEHWRLDVLLAWARANGLDQLPLLGRINSHRRIDRPFHVKRGFLPPDPHDEEVHESFARSLSGKALRAVSGL